jgi:hypothetical protein
MVPKLWFTYYVAAHDMIQSVHRKYAQWMDFSPVIIKMIKSRRMRWAADEHFGEITNAYNILVGKREG